MHRDDLLDYLNGQMSSMELKSMIIEEIELFKKSQQVKGKSARIRYDGDNKMTSIATKHLLKICNDYLNATIDEYFVSYIVDALLLSENTTFETEELKERFEILTDFKVNGFLTKERALNICN